MQRIASIRFVLAVLGIAVLLVNPAGVCAGTIGAASPSHPCCPKPSADVSKAPCICIDRQPAAPTVPAPGEQVQAAAVAPVASLAADRPVDLPEFRAVDDPSPAPHAIILSNHQLLL
jgi:hypothetical protein